MYICPYSARDIPGVRKKWPPRGAWGRGYRQRPSVRDPHVAGTGGGIIRHVGRQRTGGRGAPLLIFGWSVGVLRGR
jgi:hypothetical protein